MVSPTPADERPHASFPRWITSLLLLCLLVTGLTLLGRSWPETNLWLLSGPKETTPANDHWRLTIFLPDGQQKVWTTAYAPTRLSGEIWRIDYPSGKPIYVRADVVDRVPAEHNNVKVRVELEGPEPKPPGGVNAK